MGESLFISLPADVENQHRQVEPGFFVDTINKRKKDKCVKNT